MLKIESLIAKIESTMTGKETVFLPISHPTAVNWAKQTLEENENDYLEGAIRLEFNSEAILTEKMETTDLMFTWQTLVEPIFFPEDKDHQVTILDSLFEVRLSLGESGYTFYVTSAVDEKEFVSSTIPKEEYIRVVRAGFLAFGDFIIRNDFSFAEDSSFASFLKDYKRLKQQLNE